MDYVQSLNKFRSIYNLIQKIKDKIDVQSLNKFIKLSIIYVLSSEIFYFLPIRSGKSHLAYNARLNKFRSIYNAFRKAQNGEKVQSLIKFIKLSIIYVLPSEIFYFLPTRSGKSHLAYIARQRDFLFPPYSVGKISPRKKRSP